MEKYNKNKNYQKNHEQKPRLSRRMLAALGILATSATIYNHSSAKSEAQNYFENHPKLEQIDTKGLVNMSAPKMFDHQISDHGGFIELDAEESIRATVGHYNFERGGDHTAIATAKEPMKIRIDGDVYEYGNQIIARGSLTDVETGQKLDVSKKTSAGYIVLDNFDDDFQSGK